VVALCLGLLSALIAPGIAAAQADGLTQREFDRLIDDVTAEDPLYGPEEGELEHDPELVSLAPAEDVELADLVASATFQNPYAGTRQQFDYGIQFRSTTDKKGTASYLRFILMSDGTWGITNNEEVVFSDTYDGVDDSRSGENTLTLYAEGGLVHAAINGDYVGSVEVDIDGAGRVAVGTAFFGDSVREGSVTGYTDFSIWELGGSSSGKSGKSSDKGDSGSLGRKDDTKPTDKGSKDDSGTTKDSGSKKDTGSKKPKGTTYESPTYGYTLTYDKSWTEDANSSSDGIDLLRLTRELSYMTVYGVPSAQTPEECRDTLVLLLKNTLESASPDATLSSADDGVIEDGSRAGASYMLVEARIDLANGKYASTLTYIECGPVNGSADYLVGISHTMPKNVYEDESAARDALMETLAEAGAAPEEDVPSNTTDEPKTKDEKPSTTKTSSSNVSKGDEGRMVYVSPTYGFTVEILKGWTIEEDSVRNGYDTLVVSSDTGRVTVSGFASSGSAVRCIDSIITNLQNDPNLSNVGVGVQPDGSDSRWDTDGQSEMVVFFTAGGVNYARYYACFEGNNGQSMLVFAYEALETDIKTEFENIQTMLDLIRVP
jgi:hypothetical protein